MAHEGSDLRVSASSTARVLLANGLQPAPRRAAICTTGGRSYGATQPASWPATSSPWTPCSCNGRTYCSSPRLHNTRGHLAGVTANSAGPWVAQQARNLVAALDEEATALQFLIRDRDSTLTRAFDDIGHGLGCRRSDSFASAWRSDSSAIAQRVPGQAVAGRLRFRRTRRVRGAPPAPVVDPGLRPGFLCVLPTFCNLRAR